MLLSSHRFQVVQHVRRDGIALYIRESWAKKFTWDLGAGPIAKIRAAAWRNLRAAGIDH